MGYDASDIDVIKNRVVHHLRRQCAPERQDLGGWGESTKPVWEVPAGVAHHMRHRILVVDDDPTVREAVCAYLDLRGYRPLEAVDGEEAVEKVSTHLPDLVLLDIVTPRMNGIEALARIRTISEVPVIMLTARSSEDEEVRALRLGADDYVTKPFYQWELVARIEAVLRRCA